ncbi:ATP-binding protein [Variovorax sp. LT1R16]|uniref:ATP-binding protein n=1 Tax=Variovorax sp. LT1R16 TaxID=3443728 RepID=UPI003F46F0EC
MNDRGPSTDAMYAFGPFLLLPTQRALLHGNEPVRMGSRAFDLLAVLVERAGQIVGKDELLARVWPSSVIDEGGLRVHVAALRKILGETPSGPRYISNVPTRGYCFVAPVVCAAGAPPAAGRAEAGRQLPAMMTRLVGRDASILALVRAMPQRRFATLVGPGGLGKTTVALAAAAELEAHYADGAHFIDFSYLTDPAQVPAAVAMVLGVAHGSGNALAALHRWLATRSVLLVLDNCEHVIEAVATFAEAVLSHCSSHLLSTSREPLRARSEWLVRLPPLASPPPGAPLPWAEAMRFPAFELFVERASACAEGVMLGDDDVEKIAHLCRRLDGIPLAIELVSAQIGFYGLNGLATMLDGRMSLTALGHRTVQPRHQTLRGTLDWSYDLLPPIEQRVLARLSVFRERFTLSAAMAVAGERPSDAAHALVNLVNKSLVATDAAEGCEGSVAYRLLETTRGYAFEKLAVGNDADEVAQRHAAHCLCLLQSATIERADVDPARWRERQLRRLDDIRTALRWTLHDKGDREVGVRLVANAAVFFSGLRRMKEYLEWLERARQVVPCALEDSELHMQLCLEFGQACVAVRGGGLEGLDALRRGVAIARSLGDGSSELAALRFECSSRVLHGDYAGAHAAATCYADVATQAQDARAILSSHRILGFCLHLQGQHSHALERVRRALHSSGLSLRPSPGNVSHPDERTAALTHLARILWVSGETERAQMAARDAMDSVLALDNGMSLLYALTFAVCPVLIWCGNLEAAARQVEQLERCAQTHVLEWWQTWPKLYRKALDHLSDGLPDAPLGASKACGTLRGAQADMLATFHPAMVADDAGERALSDRNLWCAPEILRNLAERAHSEGRTERAIELVHRGLAMSRLQGAYAWQLRCAITWVRLEDSAAAREALNAMLARTVQRGPSADTELAQRLLRSAGAPSAMRLRTTTLDIS